MNRRIHKVIDRIIIISSLIFGSYNMFKYQELKKNYDLLMVSKEAIKSHRDLLRNRNDDLHSKTQKLKEETERERKREIEINKKQ